MILGWPKRKDRGQALYFKNAGADHGTLFYGCAWFIVVIFCIITGLVKKIEGAEIELIILLAIIAFAATCLFIGRLLNNQN